MTEEIISHPVDYLLLPFRLLMWVLSLPIKASTAVVVYYKQKTYDPCKTMCPACGHKGCNVTFTITSGPEKAALRCRCDKCGCDEFFVPTLLEASKWLRDVTRFTAVQRS